MEYCDFGALLEKLVQTNGELLTHVEDALRAAEQLKLPKERFLEIQNSIGSVQEFSKLAQKVSDLLEKAEKLKVS